MSVASEITRLQNAKSALKTSINAKTDSSHQIDDETLDEYSDFVDTIQTGGGEPDKGIIVTGWDNDGYPTKVKVKNMNFENYLLASSTNPNNQSDLNSFKNIKEINCTSNTNPTTVGNYCFYALTKLETINLPNTITTLGNRAFSDCTNLSLDISGKTFTLGNTSNQIGPFYKCSNLLCSSLGEGTTINSTQCFNLCSKITLSTLPDSITSIPNYTFANCTSITTFDTNKVTNVGQNAFISCTGLKKIALPLVETTNSASVSSCTSLEKVWVGSSITSSGFNRYTFTGSTKIVAIYIDLPRATVESFANYAYAFANGQISTNVIVCNDDAGFISKAEFDALVVE